MIAIETLQEFTRGTLPELLGVRFREASPERLTATITVRPDLCTSGEMVHGGTLMAFADTLGAFATVLNLRDGQNTTTIESKTCFLAGAKSGETLVAECVALHRGRRTMVWRTTIRNQAGKTLADVTQTQLVIDPR